MGIPVAEPRVAVAAVEEPADWDPRERGVDHEDREKPSKAAQ